MPEPSTNVIANGIPPLTTHLINLIEDYHSLNPSQPPLLPYPTAIEFCKQVSKGLPCVYSLPPGRQFCPAQSWTRSSLIDAVQDPVEVAITPNGRADSLQKIDGEDQPVFLQPATVNMTLSDLFDKLDQPAQKTPSSKTPPPPGIVYYLQSQNGNLNLNQTSSSSSSPSNPPPLHALLPSLPPTIPFASSTLGAPEAINLWLGTSASVTATHRDPYENLYLVLRGAKHFTLYAPVNEVALCAREVRTGRWVYDAVEKTFNAVLDDDDDDDEAEESSRKTIPWIPIDPLRPRAELQSEYPLYRYARPQRVTVGEGQVLYLPAGWFHHVEQEGGTWEDGSPAPCIAVNYWYDQDYEGEKYVMRQHVGRLVARAQEEMGRWDGRVEDGGQGEG